MSCAGLTVSDRAQLERHGVPLAEAERQLALLACADCRLELDRPARPGDGIACLGAAQATELARAWDEAVPRLRAVKFVPASGAASRMFADLLACRDGGVLSAALLSQRAAAGDAAARRLVRFAAELPRFAFYPRLSAALAAGGLAIDDLRRAGDLAPILEALLAPSGLGYAAMPKGLIDFHLYPRGPRSAFAEQIVEGVRYLAGPAGSGDARFHFTVSPQHLERFQAEAAVLTASRGCRIDFSFQSPATDCLATDLEGRPFRLADGRLLLRPGGHGSLLSNIAGLDADVAFIKNIDNVVPERAQDEVVRWKKVLGGCLVGLQGRLFAAVERLRSSESGADLAAARALAAELGAAPPAAVSAEVERAGLLASLDRPLRVCGVVRNEGEPGGGPFWVRDPRGGASLQVVEHGEIDGSRPEQAAIWESASHFNPVDLACGLTDSRGRPFDLARFQDEEAVFVSAKSHEGQPLRVLERPGLWNGSMARWITVFVEVPAATFAPVKTVLDLLRPEHRP